VPGTGKTITWNAGADWNQQSGSRMCFRVTAGNILPAASGFALIPAGSFQMGDAAGDGYAAGLPVHTVSVSPFHMAKYEVTKAMWDDVRTWGSNNGYTDLRTGAGKASNHPIQTITWYDAVKWCNARSEKDGLTPCYYTNAALTAVYRTGNTVIDNTMVNWTANGYRLPTEAEWEKAARGGLAGKRFPWGDTISFSQANYVSTGESYDLAPTRGYDPAYATGGTPYTSPVGSFAPNGYGLYDMAGNVWEWCWDLFSATYYSSSPSTDPRGASSGTDREGRGGSWYGGARDCGVAYRYGINPGLTYFHGGFRPARIQETGNAITGNLEVDTQPVTLAGSNPVSPNGDIQGLGSYVWDTTATLTATPHSGYVFTGWTGDAGGANNPLSVLMDRDKTIGATFARIPPAISNIPDRVIDEDGNTGPLAFSISDTITPAAALTVTGVSDNPGLVPNWNIVFGGSGGSRTVSVTPSPDQSGTAVITVTLSNGETTASDTFVLTVRSVNDPPTISAVADVTINEETSTPPIPFTVGDVETPAGSLVVTCNSSNLALVPLANIVPGGNGANRTVTITPAANRYGTSTITLTVSDGSATASTGFVLTVSHVNHAPVFSGYSFTTPYQTAATVYLVKILAKASDADGDTLSMMAGLSSHGSSVQVGASTLTYTPPSGFSGTDTFPVTISDSHGGTANGTVTVTVQPSSTAGGAGTNPPVVTVLSGGRVGIAFQGIPGHTYLVQRSTDLANWLTLATLVAGTDGAISYTDESPPPGSAYYRLAKP